MSEFIYKHIIEFALAQSDGRVRFIVLTTIVDRRAFKQLPHTHTHTHTHTHAHYCDMREDFGFLKLVNTKITIYFDYDAV
jgi:hypothetical protein